MTKFSLSTFGGAVYLLLLFIPLSLHISSLPLLVTDIGVLLLLPGLWTQRSAISQMFGHTDELSQFILWACWIILASVVNLFQGGSLYNCAVFLYMAMLYLFFRFNSESLRNGLASFGILIFAILLASYLYTSGRSDTSMYYIDPHGDVNPSGFLMRRFQFLFSNPNLLGAAYIIPVLMVLPALTTRLKDKKSSPLEQIILLLLAFFSCLPLFSTASKHSLMTMALYASAFGQTRLLRRPYALSIAFCLTMVFGAICLATVWFRTYPAVRQAPYIDVHHTSNYMIHQEIYAKMLIGASVHNTLFGFTTSQLHRNYRKNADTERIQEILEPYHAEDMLVTFATFMDPHNEYLNSASFFGIPALLTLLAFLIWSLVTACKTGNMAMVFFIPALMICCLWDDLLSKRFIWCALGLLASTSATTTVSHIRTEKVSQNATRRK